MVQGRQSDAWDHTAHLLAMVFNCHMDTRKGGAKSAADFHPFPGNKPRPKEDMVVGVLDRDGLYDLFINGKMPSKVGNPP